MTVFSIPEKMFSKIESLMCILRAHVNRTQFKNIRINLSINQFVYYLKPTETLRYDMNVVRKLNMEYEFN